MPRNLFDSSKTRQYLPIPDSVVDKSVNRESAAGTIDSSQNQQREEAPQVGLAEAVRLFLEMTAG